MTSVVHRLLSNASITTASVSILIFVYVYIGLAAVAAAVGKRHVEQPNISRF
jgi:hypothetical protein